jgi:hypothetical protein
LRSPAYAMMGACHVDKFDLRNPAPMPGKWGYRPRQEAPAGRSAHRRWAPRVAIGGSAVLVLGSRVTQGSQSTGQVRESDWIAPVEINVVEL